MTQAAITGYVQGWWIPPSSTMCHIFHLGEDIRISPQMPFSPSFPRIIETVLNVVKSKFCCHCFVCCFVKRYKSFLIMVYLSTSYSTTTTTTKNLGKGETKTQEVVWIIYHVSIIKWMTSHETDWVDLSVSSFDWGESTGIIKLIITIIPVLLKFAVSFSWMTSQTSRGCTTSFPYSAFPFRNTASTLCAAQLYPSAVCQCLLWWLLGFYLESHCWTCSWLKWKTIPSSCVSAEILYGQPHGFETVKSALPVQCPFQACCQWGLYAALSRFWQVSSFLLSVAPSPPPPPSYHCSVTSLLCCFLFFPLFFSFF